MRSLFILPLLLTSFAFAQAPQLLVTNPENPAERPHPIALAKADVQLLIAGRLCQTTMTLTFRNDADRVLEGELVFPLPENATVCGYGLDIGGQLVEAVTIEKDKARVVFETEARRGIDPGIVEKVQGNNFRTRVHPIPAKGTRTVRVQYVSDPTVADGQLMYKLPLQWPGAAPEITVTIESLSASAPKVEALPELKFESDGDHHVARQMITKPITAEVLATLPLGAAKTSVIERRTHSTASVENLDPKAAEQFVKTDYYFVAGDSTLPPSVRGPLMRAKPGRIAIAWDASLSRGEVDHAKEFDLIRKHLAALGDVGVELIVFRNVPEASKGFLIQKGDASALIKYLSELPYDGGTNLGAVEFTRETAAERGIDRAKTPPPIAYYLLFTDGLSNLGPEQPAMVDVPVYAVSSDPRSNHNLLRRISTASGGQYLNLASLSPDQAAASVMQSPFSLISIDADPKEVADIYPRLPQPVDGRVTIAGKLLAKTATLTLNYGRDGVISQRVPITISQDGASEMNLVSRYWAQLKLADLSANVDRNETEITALGKQFNLVTPYTSMIVLETVDQYLRHKIVPPRSRGKIYSQFMQQIEQQQAVAQTEEKAKIDRVVTMWQNRLAWWNQEFKYAADFKYVAPPEAKPAAGAAASLATDHETTLAGTRVTNIRQSGSQPASGGRGGGGGGFGGSPAGSLAGRGLAHGEAESAPTTPAPDVNSPTPTQTASTHDLYARIDRFSEDGSQVRARREAGEVAGRGDRGALLDLGARDPAKADVNFGDVVEANILLKAWSPDTPYLKALQAASADKAYDVYLKQRNAYKSSPAFYLDCADFFAKTNPEIALRILTNIPELALDDGRLLRIAAHRLQQLDQLDLAIDLFERIVKLRPEEPQSFRDLALALGDRADALMARHDTDRARSDYQRSLDLLHKVVMNHWDRFDEIELIALTEANRLLVRAKSASDNSPKLSISNPFDSRLIKLLDPDLRIVMTWDTDNTDIDLHVTEPTGETCVYNHNRTTIGGALSKDFTQGYGPEEYLLKKLMPGQYKIQAHFYGNRDQRVVGPTTVQATVITHYGRNDESRQSLTLRLKDAKDMVDVGTVTLK